MTKGILQNLDAILRNSDKRYRAKLVKKTKLSRPSVNVYFRGAINAALTTAIKEDLLVIKAGKQSQISQLETDIEQIQKMYESLNEV